MKRSQVYSISFRPGFYVLSAMLGIGISNNNYDQFIGGVLIYGVMIAATCIQMHANVLVLDQEDEKEEAREKANDETFH